jgi:hypothetical protein
MVMIKNVTVLIAAIVITALITLPAYSKDSKDDDIRWQTVSKELDALPFSQTYIDSVIKAHIGGNSDQRKLRKVESGIIENGETLVYEVGWGRVKAGFMILSVEHHRDKGLIRLSCKFMSNNFVSSIYKIRNHLISWVDAEGFYPVFFEDHAREGSKYKTDFYTVFDNKNGNLYNKRKKEAKEHNTPLFTHDYVSILYYARLMQLNPGNTFTVDLFSEKKTYPFKFKIHNKLETIKTGAGTFDNCIRVEPTILGDGKVFGRGDKIEVWVASNKHKYPVRVKSKAKVGSITANLIHVAR